jgi:O-antigen/teichoic acid export membrane protein
MRAELKALSKETVVYGLSTVIGRFLNFLLVPFYVNVLRSTAEYGIATSLYTYIGFLNVIYPLGLEAAFFRYGARGEGQPYNPEQERDLFSSPFFLIFLVSAVLSVLVYLLAPWIVWPVFRDPVTDITPMVPELTRILRYGAGILFFDALSVLPFAVLRLEHQAKRFAGIRLLGIVVTLILNIVFVMKFRWGVGGIFLANLIASILIFALLLPTILPRLIARLDKAVLTRMIPFGLTNVPAYLASMMVQVIDRPIVQAYLGLGVLGVYQANYRMGFTMMIFVSLFEYAWRPFFMRQSLKDDAQARLLFARVFTYFMGIALGAFVLLSWALPTIVSTPFHGHRVFKEPYLVGLPIVPVVLLAYVFQGMYTNFIAGIYIKERNRALPFITGAGALVNVAANLFLIPRIGIMGAAIATLLAYIVMAIAIYRVAQKAYPIPYEWGKVRLFFILAALAYAVGRFV